MRELTNTDRLLLGRMGSYRRYYGKRKQFEAGECPFCTIDPKINKVIFENDYWVMWEVPQAFSRRDSSLQLYLLIVAKNAETGCGHVTTIDGQARDFWKYLGEMIDWAFDHYQIPGGMLSVRFGDPEYSAATEEHLHCNLKVPNLTNEVREAIAKNPDQVLANFERGTRFSTLYGAGITPDQFDKMVEQGDYDKEGNEIL